MDKVIVVGGGPAGASAALGFLRAGYDVTLLEQRSHWQGRVCGAFLDAEAVRHLRWLKAFDEIQSAGAVAIPTSVLTTPRSAVVRLKTEQGGDTGWGFPRQKLEEILLQEVAKHGGRLRNGTRMLSYKEDGGRWAVEARDNAGPFRLEAKHLVMAAGRFAGMPSSEKKFSGWFGWNAAFTHVAQEAGEMSMHFYTGGYVGVLTFADGSTNVCGLRHQRKGEHKGWDDVFADAMERQPGLRELLDDAKQVSEWHGVGPLPFGRRKFSENGPILAGDAAAVGDPFMGEGIGRALGAGPMIFQTLQKLGLGADDENLRREYARLWRKSYTARFKMGFWLRRFLDQAPFSGPLLEFIVQKPSLLRRVTPLLHRGFSPTGSEK